MKKLVFLITLLVYSLGSHAQWLSLNNDFTPSPAAHSPSEMEQNFSAEAKNYNWGVGLRLGDPFGVSVKRFWKKNTALEFNFGQTGWGYNANNRFNEFNGFNNYRYIDSRGSYALSFQAHYLMYTPFRDRDLRGLSWYWGFGAQVISYSVDYLYEYTVITRNGNRRTETRWERGVDVDLGGDAVLGLEYPFPGTDFAVFGDVMLYLEILDSPFFARAQGGIGVRYNF
jgi:hypothetical protein